MVPRGLRVVFDDFSMSLEDSPLSLGESILFLDESVISLVKLTMSIDGSALSHTVIKAFACVALLPVILGIITSNNCEFLAGLDYQYLLVQVPVITGSITTSVFTKYYW